MKLSDHFTERELWFIISFFLPDYQKSSVKNDIGEWLLGRREEKPATQEEIDYWFQNWIAMMDNKRFVIGKAFLKKKEMPGVRRTKNFFDDVWEQAVLWKRAKGGRIIERYLDLLTEVQRAVWCDYQQRRKKKGKTKTYEQRLMTNIQDAIVRQMQNEEIQNGS